MEKKFKLPKAFAKKWLKALRGDKYKQTDGQLLSSPESRLTMANSTFCCLGVAGHLCGYKLIDLEGGGFLTKDKFSSAPIEIQGEAEYNDFVEILASLNDGISNGQKKAYTEKGYVFRPTEEESYYTFTFAQIADFIEDNTEFYKAVRTKKEK
jgi:hypothetical protein